MQKVIFFSSPINKVLVPEFEKVWHLGVTGLQPLSPENPFKEIKRVFRRRGLQDSNPQVSCLFGIKKQNPVDWWRKNYDFSQWIFFFQIRCRGRHQKNIVSLYPRYIAKLNLTLQNWWNFFNFPFILPIGPRYFCKRERERGGELFLTFSSVKPF